MHIYHPVAFQRAMKVIERLCKPAYAQLSKLDPKAWTKAYFQTYSYADNVENNMSECFNAWIINERYMPLSNMLQEIHFKLMVRIRKKREELLNYDTQICPRIKKKLDENITWSRKWTASWDGARHYAVKQGTRSTTVDLVNKTCDCRLFQLTGIPCPHAVATIHDRRENPVNFVSAFYKREKYLKSYENSLEALKGDEFWEMVSTEKVLPPDLPKKLRGRPKKLRRREEWEGGNRNRGVESLASQLNVQRFSAKRVMHCSGCKEGHRINKCPNPRNNEGFGENQSQQHVQENQSQHVEQVVRPKPNKIYKSKVRPILPWRQKNLTANEGASSKNAATLKDPPNVDQMSQAQSRPKLPVRKANDKSPLGYSSGYSSVFMPTPGWSFKLHNGTPSEDDPYNLGNN